MSEPRWSIDGVPERPGVYVFRSAEGRVLYVGKAANLRDRLRSYRRAGGDGRLMIRFLESEAHAVETIVTRTEQEALLLEDEWIKTHQPPHNVRLKDDKSFLMLELDLAERFPRFHFVRAHGRKGRSKSAKSASRSTRVFGPFASASAVRQALSDLHRVVALRDCPDTVMNHRSRPCLKHQLGLCSAPCVGLIDDAAYAELVQRAARILSGETGELERELEERMRSASAAMEYERAAQWRDRLAALRRTVEGQGVRAKDDVARDVLGLARRADAAVIHRLAFRDGRLAGSRAHVFRTQLPDEELLHQVLTAWYVERKRDDASEPDEALEIVLPCDPADRAMLERMLGDRFVLRVPESGDKKRMLDLAGENARSELVRRERERASEEEALLELARVADLDGPPETIDCFDISNLQGTNVVASRVRFRSGHADKAGYRRFKVRGVAGQDDFASMREVVVRSLRRGLEDGDLPDLVVIDGGAAQLAAALEAREESGAFDVPFVALAKARSERNVKGKTKAASEERLYLPGAVDAIELPRASRGRLLLERIRDEAHRFAITYHRKERGKITSRLDSIPGLGPKKRRALLTRFGSVQGVQAASVEELAAVPSIGPALAKTILEHLRPDGLEPRTSSG